MKSYLTTFSLLVFISSGYGQDSDTIFTQETPIDSPTIKHDSVNMHKIDTVVIIRKEVVFENPYIEKGKILGLYKEADNAHIKYLITQKVSQEIRSQQLREAADRSLNQWNSDYPVASKLERSKHILYKAGIIQIAAGSLGSILTIRNATGKSTFYYKVGEKIESVSVDNKWNAYHTMIMSLSIGLIASGIVTINF
jgi:hypothetical protein